MISLSAVTKNILNLVYPMRCAACKMPLEAADRTGVCPACMAAVNRNPEPYCGICGRSLADGNRICGDCRRSRPHFTLARSACLYEGAVKEMVHAFKYGNRRSLARPLAGLMSDLLKYESALTGGVEAVTFVPLHPRRLAERDFNQSELLARLMAAALELPFASCLEKIKNTGHQNELPREKRLHNLKGAFRAKSGGRKFITGASVLLIDDVMTTGATLDECSRTLLEAGAREVRCATLARGI